MESPSLHAFVERAFEFRALAEREAPLSREDLCKIRDLLLDFIRGIAAIDQAPHDVPAGDENSRPGPSERARVLRQFGSLEIDCYRVVFDPFNMEATDEPSLGMLADDLTDIYSDLVEGLAFVEKGDLRKACFTWSFNYRSHWGRHAVNALVAIETYRFDRNIGLPPAGLL